MKGRKFFISTGLVLSCFVAILGLANDDPLGEESWLDRLRDFHFTKILKITAGEQITKDVGGLAAFTSVVGKGKSLAKGWTNFTTASLIKDAWDGITLRGSDINSELIKIEVSGQELTGDLSKVSSEFNELKKLEVLDISINKITNIPDFSPLSELTTLKLDSNSLSGIIPKTLGKISKLTSLDLSKNNYDSIPDDLVTSWGSSATLRSINLENNNLDFGDLEKLEPIISKIKYSNPTITHSPVLDSIEVDEGNEAYYSVKEPNGSRNIYTWYFNGLEQIRQKDSADLSIKLVSEADSGDWVLKVTNEVITTESVFITVRVKVKKCIVTGADAYFTTASGTSRTDKYTVTVCESDTLKLPVIYGNKGTVKGNTIQYQWETAQKDTTRWDKVGDELNYQPRSIKDTTLYRLVVSSDLCDPDTSTIVKINYIAKLDSNYITTKEKTICKTDTIPTLEASTPIGGGGQSSYLYQWQSRSAKDTAWIDEGQSKNYTPSSLTDTTFFRRVVTSKKGCELSDTSATVRFNVFPDVQSNTISYDQEICPNGIALTLKDTTFNLDSLSWDVENFTFAWQKSLDKIQWSRADTVYNTDSLPEFTPRNVTQETFYRRVVAGQCGGDTSNIVTISMFEQIKNNVIDANNTKVCERSEKTITLKAVDGSDSLTINTWENADTITFSGSNPVGGGEDYTYVWQSSLDSLNWSERSTQDTLRLNDTEFTDTLTYIRRIVNSKCYSDTSNVIEIEKTFNFGKNQIGTSQLLCIGTDPDTLIGNPQTTKGNFTFEWQVSGDSINWQAAGSDTIASKQNLGLDSLEAGYYYYRRAVLGGCSPNYSNVITLEVASPISNNTIAGSQEICEGDTVALIQATELLGGGGGYSYEWQSTTDTATRTTPNEVLWTRSDTSKFLQPDRITKTTFYRRIAYANRCNPDTSNVVEVKVYNKIDENTIRDNQDICLGEDLNLLVGSTPIGGDLDMLTAWNYAWQSRTEGSDWTSLGSEKDYEPEDLREPTWFRRVVTIATPGGRNCFADTSEVVYINVVRKIKDNRITSGRQVICLHDQPDSLTATIPDDGVKLFDYRWQMTYDLEDQWVADDNFTTVYANWVDVPSNKDINYYPFSPDTTARYRRIVSNTCFSDTTNAEIISVLPLPEVSAGKDTLINIGQSIQLQAQGASRYVWNYHDSFGDSTQIFLANPTVKPLVSRKYIVKGTDSKGCSNTDTIFVRVKDEPVIRVSQVITPNGDGLNDNLYIEGIEKYTENTVWIFNRWGTELVKILNYVNDSETSWTGFLEDGTQVPNGVYFYMIKFGVTERVIRGSVTVINN